MRIQWKNLDERNLPNYVQEHQGLEREDNIKELFQIEVDQKDLTLSKMHGPE